MSALDPVKSVQTHEHDLDIRTHLRRTLERLAQLPPSVGAPYLTATVNWQASGEQPRRRAGQAEFAQAAERLLDGPRGRSEATATLDAGIERIERYLADEASDDAQSIIFVACDAKNVFEAIPLGLDLPTTVAVGPTPVLIELARAMEDHPTYAVLVADQREATLAFITQRRERRSLEVRGTDFPARQKQGGWSQRRYQDRADERIEHFLTEVAEHVREELQRRRVSMLVLAADDRTTTGLRDELHQSIQDRIVGTVALDIRATEQDVVEATWPIVEQAEREREQQAVQAARDNAGSGGAGVVGAEDVLTALQAGQVLKLVMNDDFHGDGWADYTMPLYGVGAPPSSHPGGGDLGKLTAIQVEAEMVRLAVQSDAEIEIVRSEVPVSAEEQREIRDVDEPWPRAEAAKALDEVGGVAAILRFALDADQSTAEL
ncbi:MAG TPA: Vms1/Ankzf1 family peptidyl-tRNA hydrolase [Thermomicrobiales bacterium]|nr:Vms1/Ankzf1 family peptidyl-tRNA hydrolase [Thermomicrobiales bacterium]